MVRLLRFGCLSVTRSQLGTENSLESDLDWA